MPGTVIPAATRRPGSGHSTRPVTAEADARLVLDWRNDAVTREASFDTGIREWDGFWATLREWVARDPIPPSLVLWDGEPVAFLRFNPPKMDETVPEAVEISIHVAPEHRRAGHGLGALAVGAGLAAGAGFRAVIALVKADNLASLRLFERAGYRRTGEMIVERDGAVWPVIVHRLDLA